MGEIGILAYGSLIDDPGCELQPLVRRRIRHVFTPFHVEFARLSSTRDYAPTLIPVEEGGSHVGAQILLLNNNVSMDKAKDLLWRRETHQKLSSRKHYREPCCRNADQVVIRVLNNLAGVETVLYTKIGGNIDPEERTPGFLATKAIQSAKSTTGAEKKDGITYLLNAKRNGILTPMLPEYEREILRRTGTKNLEDAWEQARAR